MKPSFGIGVIHHFIPANFCTYSILNNEKQEAQSDRTHINLKYYSVFSKNTSSRCSIHLSKAIRHHFASGRNFQGSLISSFSAIRAVRARISLPLQDFNTTKLIPKVEVESCEPNCINPPTNSFVVDFTTVLSSCLNEAPSVVFSRPASKTLSSFSSKNMTLFSFSHQLLHGIFFQGLPALCYSPKYTKHDSLDPPREIETASRALPQQTEAGQPPSLVSSKTLFAGGKCEETSTSTPSQSEYVKRVYSRCEDKSNESSRSLETRAASIKDNTSINDVTMRVEETNKVLVADSDQFPYTCPPDASVRLHYAENKPWWKVLFAGLALSFFICIWIVSAFFPFYLAYWIYDQGKDMCNFYFTQATKFEAPKIVQFYNKIHFAFISLVTHLIRTMKAVPNFIMSPSISPSCISDSIVTSYQSTFQHLNEIVRSLDLGSHLCVVYLTSIIIMNIRDLFKGPIKLPEFVKTADDLDMSCIERFRLRLMRSTLDWFLPGSAVIFEDYHQFVVSGRFGNPPTLICYHPHGIISLGMFFLLQLPELEGFRIMGAPILKYFCPLFRIMFSKAYVLLGSADRASFKEAMKNQESLILVPGGVHEATITDWGKEKIYIKNRKGFIRYSLQHGYSLTPVYAFGENICYSHLLSNLLHDLKFWLNSKGIPTVLPFGSLFWPFGLLPNRVPSLLVVGTPMTLPKIENPTPDEVDMYHKRYISETRKLYITYAESYYRYCKLRYNITTPAPTPEDNNKAIVFLAEAPPLQSYTWLEVEYTMVWHHHTVEKLLDAPVEFAYDFYHNLENHTKWASWLVSIKYEDEERTVSQWTLRKLGVTLNFTAKNTKEIRPELIEFVSLGELQFSGSIKFEPVAENQTRIVLTVGYCLPTFITLVFRPSWLDHFVTNMLASDLSKLNELLQLELSHKSQSCPELCRLDNEVLTEDIILMKENTHLSGSALHFAQPAEDIDIFTQS